jgi:hypothetical protein
MLLQGTSPDPAVLVLMLVLAEHCLGRSSLLCGALMRVSMDRLGD